MTHLQHTFDWLLGQKKSSSGPALPQSYAEPSDGGNPHPDESRQDLGFIFTTVKNASYRPYERCQRLDPILGDYLGVECIIFTSDQGLSLHTAQEQVAMIGRNITDAVHRDR